jgi:hypothetical protein
VEQNNDRLFRFGNKGVENVAGSGRSFCHLNGRFGQEAFYSRFKRALNPLYNATAFKTGHRSSYDFCALLRCQVAWICSSQLRLYPGAPVALQRLVSARPHRASSTQTAQRSRQIACRFHLCNLQCRIKTTLARERTQCAH